MSLSLSIALCLLMEALFTGAEMVLISADRHKLNERAMRGEKGARIALDLLSKPERTLATTLTGTDLFLVVNTVVTTSFFLARFGDNAEWLTVLVIGPLVILFGEIVPKTFARPRADALAGAAARFVRGAQIALYPLVVAVSAVSRLLARPFGGMPPLHDAVTREELGLMLQASRHGTDMEDHEKVMVRRVFRFGEKKVADIFRPLAQVLALPEDAMCRDAVVLASRSGFSRYPIYRERIDHVVGFVHILDAMGRPPETPVRPLLRSALFVPELMPIDDLMRKFQEAGSTFAFVVDEYGGVTGIVTAEDVVEEVVGEIEDEYDRGMDYYKKTPEGDLLVPGRMEVRRLEEALGVHLPPGDYATVGGMLTALAGGIPAAGEAFDAAGVRFIVERASERVVLEVRVRRIPDAGEAPPPPAEG